MKNTDIYEYLKKYNQEHILCQLEKLNPKEKEILINQYFLKYNIYCKATITISFTQIIKLIIISSSW